MASIRYEKKITNSTLLVALPFLLASYWTAAVRFWRMLRTMK